MTRALSGAETCTLGGAPDWGVTPADPMGATVRRISGPGGDRIVVRARFTYDPTMEVSETRLARVGRLHDAKFRDRFPMLGDVTMDYRWAGHLCLSLNGVSVTGSDIKTNHAPTSLISLDAANTFTATVHNSSVDSAGNPMWTKFQLRSPG